MIAAEADCGGTRRGRALAELLDKLAAGRGPLDTAEDKAGIARFMRLLGGRRRGRSAG